jgi:rubrerythrin
MKKIRNVTPLKGKTTRTIRGKLYYYIGRSLYWTKADLVKRELLEQGVGVAITKRRDIGYLIWATKPIHVPLMEVGDYDLYESNNPRKPKEFNKRGMETIRPYLGRMSKADLMNIAGLNIKEAQKMTKEQLVEKAVDNSYGTLWMNPGSKYHEIMMHNYGKEKRSLEATGHYILASHFAGREAAHEESLKAIEHGIKNPTKDGKTELVCNFCGKHFFRKIGPKTFEIKCPKCGEYDIELANPRYTRKELADILYTYDKKKLEEIVHRHYKIVSTKGAPKGVLVGMILDAEIGKNPTGPWKGLPFAPEYYANPMQYPFCGGKMKRIPGGPGHSQSLGPMMGGKTPDKWYCSAYQYTMEDNPKGKVRRYNWEDRPLIMVTDKTGVTYSLPRKSDDFKYRYVTKENPGKSHYIISVNKKPSTGEWLASVNKDGKFYEPATAYCDSPAEAVDQAIAIIEGYRQHGESADLSNAKRTVDLVTKYRYDWIWKEIRAAAKEAMER